MFKCKWPDVVDREDEILCTEVTASELPGENVRGLFGIGLDRHQDDLLVCEPFQRRKQSVIDAGQCYTGSFESMSAGWYMSKSVTGMSGLGGVIRTPDFDVISLPELESSSGGIQVGPKTNDMEKTSYLGAFYTEESNTTVADFQALTEKFRKLPSLCRNKGQCSSIEEQTYNDYKTTKKVVARNVDSTLSGSALAEISLRENGPQGVLVGAPLFSHNKLGGAVFGYGYNSGRFDKSNSFGTEFGYDFILDATAFDDYEPERSEGETQFGARFGSAIAAGDFNADGFTDIAIGAPNWSKVGTTLFSDTGRVYIFHQSANSERRFSSKLGTYFEPSQVLKPDTRYPEAAGFHFGAALASDGDFNDDGYADLVVAAPNAFEKGLVFIYNGQAGGLQEEPSQIIEEQSVRSFGFSVAFKSDVDQNQYQDLVVSAPDSNDVFIYKTRPSIEVEITLNVPDQPLDDKLLCPNSDIELCLTIEVCGRYSGKGLPANLPGNAHVELDSASTQKRVSNTNGEHSIDIKWGNMRKDVKKCKDIDLRVQWTTANKISPVVIEGNLQMSETADGTDPIQNPYVQNETTKKIYFWKDCGDDNKCDTSFDGSNELVNQIGYVELGEENPLLADEEVTVVNKVSFRINGEKSYGSMLEITTSGESAGLVRREMVKMDQNTLNCENVATNQTHQTDLCFFKEPTGFTQPGTYDIDMHYSVRPNGKALSFFMDAKFNNTNEEAAHFSTSKAGLKTFSVFIIAHDLCGININFNSFWTHE